MSTYTLNEAQHKSVFRILSKGRVSLVTSAYLISTTLCFAAPIGGTVSAGNATITSSGSTTTINQNTQNASINWQNFSIASGERVNFIQPSSSSITLNRVVGGEKSIIDGMLNANGQVFILNSNGVLFGKNSSVNTAGLLASTMNMSDNDFMNKNYRLTSNGSKASVVNNGEITVSDGGYAALIATDVKNNGVIRATLGSVLMSSGEQITLTIDDNALIGYTIDKVALESLIENHGAIYADGGEVYLTTKALDGVVKGVVNNDGIIEAQTLENKEGKIILWGETTYVNGTLDASAQGSGNGGFIETSGEHVKIAGNARVTTYATNGESGTWVIDPVDFTIAASGGDMTGTALTAALSGGNVTILSSNGAAGTAGDVNVNDTVTWSANTLTLNAQNNININAAMNSSGTAGLALQYGQGAVAAGNTSIYNVRAPINLASTGSFSTKLGSDGATVNYTILTGLGAEGSTTGTDLQGMIGNLAGKYVLGADIDASPTSGWNPDGSGGHYGFTPVGGWTVGTEFTGTLDGLGHAITGLTINRPAIDDVGLFGYAKGATLHNIGLEGGNIAGKNHVGGLVGAATATAIGNSYVTGNVNGTGGNVGGLAGDIVSTSVTNSYATGTINGVDTVGGLVGGVSATSSIANSYAAGPVSGSSHVGGLVGYSSGAITASFWDKTVTPTDNGSGIGKTTSELKTLSTFAGWNIDDAGGTGKVWRIYDGYTTPLLRGFLTPLNVQPDYDGSGAVMAGIGAYTISGAYDASKVLGTIANSLTLSSTGAGAYTAALSSGLYSTQRGYDLATSRTIATPGSAAGDIVIDTPISWTSGMLNINATGNLAINGQMSWTGDTVNITAGGNATVAAPLSWTTGTLNIAATDIALDAQASWSGGTLNINATGNTAITAPISWNGGTLNIDATGTVTDTAAVNGTGSAIFKLQNGSWSQVNAALPGFDVVDFRISGGSFLRALSGDGTAGTPYRLTDIYGVQGMGSNGLRSLHFQLANDVAAAATANWNAGTGFSPIGTGGADFSGSFDGQYHTIGGLTINRPGIAYAGLFGHSNGSTLRRIGLIDPTITGGNYTGALLGSCSGGSSISEVYVQGGNVSGVNNVGGLVGYVGASSIANSYATPAGITGTGLVGGLVGSALMGSISNSYAAGLVAGAAGVGGLVGSASMSTVTASYWDTQTTGQATSAGGTGKTTAEMKNLANFSGWDIDAAGGTGKVWRSYNGYTYPLLRGFLAPLNVQPTYDGSGAALTNIGAVTSVGAYDATKVFSGSLNADTLTLSSTGPTGYDAISTAKNVYSSQQGYDITSVSRGITTAGTLVGDIKLTAPISWTSGTLAINTTGTITETAAINGTGTAIFDLQAGSWQQINASLPAFAAYDFRISGGNFFRSLGGGMGIGVPYELADIYGVQGMGSSGTMLARDYLLMNDVDASGTANWNAGAGFNPVGNSGTKFTGNFSGQNHTVTGLTINRPTTDYVGLFGYATGALSNVGLLNSTISGQNITGSLAGRSDGAVSYSYADGGSVTGGMHVGGGLLGQTAGSVAYSYANVGVSGNSNGGVSSASFGGLVGVLLNGGSVDNSYATGSVSAKDSVGGLVGQVPNGTVSNSYATGPVTGSSNVGGLVGRVTNSTGIVDSSNYWNANISAPGVGTIDPGATFAATGKTTAEMKQLATFAGWDIDAAGGTGKVWRIYDGNTYPLLRYLLTPLTATAIAASKTYDGLAYSGGNGVTYSAAPNANLLGTISYGGSSQGAVNVGGYVITPSGLYANQHGYDISYADGTLTIDPAPIIEPIQVHVIQPTLETGTVQNGTIVDASMYGTRYDTEGWETSEPLNQLVTPYIHERAMYTAYSDNSDTQRTLESVKPDQSNGESVLSSNASLLSLAGGGINLPEPLEQLFFKDKESE